MMRTADVRAFWSMVPGRSLWLFFAAIFCLFATFGFLADALGLGRSGAGELAVTVVISGLVAVVYGYLGTRAPRWLPLAVVVHVVLMGVVRRVFPGGPSLDGEVLRARIALDVAGTVAGIVFSYVLFLTFFAREGRRYLRAHAEVALAKGIHADLVPALSARHGDFEFSGFSQPSGEVGGDLVDLVETPDGGWTAYVADVTGHGVPAGLLMAMTKSAARMKLQSAPSLPEWLRALNAALRPLKKPSMFVTVAAIRWSPLDGLRMTVAGHLPVLRCGASSGEVEELTTSQVPIGVIDDYAFADRELPSSDGDLFAVLTDGIIEVFDGRDRELGLDAIKDVIGRHRAAPLPAIRHHVLEAARTHGAHLDDQTLLLVRRAPQAE
jgi:serine phosphatase RsbU (regulator of sigma subunit)